jgi:small-conductance mechanosensitive channel
MNNWWQQVFFHNTIQAWLIAIGIVLVGFSVLKLIKKTVISTLKKWAGKTATTFDDLIVAGVEKSIFPILYISLLYAGISYLSLSEKWEHRISVALWIVVMFFVLRMITACLRYFILSALKDKENSEVRQKQAGGLIIIFNFCIYIVGFIFVLDNLGYNMATLLTGLGIGGIAIALAAQAILGDLFSYFAIYFDKPFEVGDFVQVDDKAGVIEYIGIKTTRVRNPAGEQIVFSNQDLTKSRLHNFGRMEKRRVVFNFGVIYDTPIDKIKLIPDTVKEIINQQENVNFDRGHFTGFNHSSMNFEFVYYVLTPDFNFYMSTHQGIYLAILQSFEKMDVKFAYPTQTLFLKHTTEPEHEKLKKSQDILSH